MDSNPPKTLPAAVPLHRQIQNLWTNFNNILDRPVLTIKISFPNFNNNSFCSSFFGKKKINNHSLTTYEIKNRMLDTSVYKIGNTAKNRFALKSKSDAGKLELYCVSKTDAEDLFTDVFCPVDEDDNATIMDTPLGHVVKFEGRVPPISLVPELTQVKNAIELMNKDRKKDMADLSFSGVPVFQSRCLSMGYRGADYTPVFFRKEDLEKGIAEAVKPENRDVIEVSSFEDIIQKMKDNSISESNDILFIGPGEITN